MLLTIENSLGNIHLSGKFCKWFFHKPVLLLHLLILRRLLLLSDFICHESRNLHLKVARTEPILQIEVTQTIFKTHTCKFVDTNVCRARIKKARSSYIHLSNWTSMNFWFFQTFKLRVWNRVTRLCRSQAEYLAPFANRLILLY